MKLVRKLYNRYFSQEKEFVLLIKQLSGLTPANIELFKQAFYHKSREYDNQNLCKLQSNERLEYLGDAILSTVVGDYLFKKFPTKDEGYLTKMRSIVVKRKTLNAVAKNMGLDAILRNYNRVDVSNSMLGNALEALIGAVYLENGFLKTRNFIIKKIILQYVDIKHLEAYDDNYKSRLLEWSQKEGKQIDYKMLSRSKYNKRDHFKVAVFVGNEQLGVAEDFNKKSAEQKASRKALDTLNITETLKKSGPPVK